MKLRIVLLLLTVTFFLGCSISSKDVKGIYLGVMNDLNDKSAEYFIQLYENGQYALRKTPYEDGSHSLFRSGRWSIDGSLIIL